MKNSVYTIALSVFLLQSLHTYSQKLKNSHIISFYNLENLFDTIDAPGVNDEEYTPNGSKKWTSDRYNNKLNNLSKVINDIGNDVGIKGGPSILGVCEVENKAVLEDLISAKKLKKSGYSIIHYNSPDKRGIDVALLYRNKYFEPATSKTQSLYIYNPVNGKRIYTRDQLIVSGKLEGENIHIIVNHWPSRWGGELNSKPLRIAAAQVCRHVVDSLQKADSSAKIVVMGDFNDDPDNLSIESYLNATGNSTKLNSYNLYNATQPLFAKGYGTLKFRGEWNLFDQIILSAPMLDKPGISFISAGIFSPDYLLQQDGKFKGYPLRTFGGDTYLNGYSDHLPSYILVEIKQ